MFPMQKRLREEDEAEKDDSGNTGDVHKVRHLGLSTSFSHAQIHQKPRTLAFRTSPTARHHQTSFQTFHPPRSRSNSASNMTPPESSEDEHGQKLASKPPPAAPEKPCNDNDYDMDMVDAQPSLSPPRCDRLDTVAGTPPRPGIINLCLTTPPRESQEAAHGGRVPTPRWGHFRSRDISMDLGDVVEDDFPDGSTCSQLEWNHRALLRRRRLPSPIGEDFGMVSSSSAVTGPSLESLERLNLQGRNATSMEQTGIQTDSALSHGSRISTSGKTTLSMGFRANCEKCRARVPGHYNHVIRT